MNKAFVLLCGAAMYAAPAYAADNNAGSTDLSSINANGTPAPIRTGFFAETEIGGFLTIGGANYSNTEAFLGIGVGYDILENLSIAAQFQLSPSAQDCYNFNNGGSTPNCGASSTGTSKFPPGADTFTISSVDLKLSYRIPIVERLYIPVRVFGGLANLAPAPIPGLSAFTFSVGGASGIEWATPFDHFGLGFEVAGRFVGEINALALSFYPTVKYTF